MDERELPTNKIHDYVTWPTTTPIFDDGRGGLAFPEQNNSNCHFDENGDLVTDRKLVSANVSAGVVYTDGNNPITSSDIVYQPSYSVEIRPDVLSFKVKSFTYSNGSGTITLVDSLTSQLVPYLNTSATFFATTPDTLECTKLVSADIAVNPVEGDTIEFTTSDLVVDGVDVPFDMTTGISFDLLISLKDISSDTIYAYLANQDDSSQNGVYAYTAGHVARVASSPIDPDIDANQLLSDPTVNDNVECCHHYRKSYSHKEVHDRVYDLVGKVTGFGVKSMSFSNCDGGLIDWFTSIGKVNLGNGHSSVFVNGFGLGQMYKAALSSEAEYPVLPKDGFDENDGVLHPWLQWAYGTRYDAKTSTDICALPRDWPFTHLTATEEQPIFNKLTDTNNITLVRKCSAGVGNLEMDRIEYDDETGDPKIDPDTGEPITSKVYYNKHHIVLYPDYTAITNKEGYSDGSVVVKPLFVHLPAPIDTKDGETIDITFSIQNVDPNAFGDTSTPENAKKALSGYYAAMSRPRVYVMGGVQKFSNKKLPITVDLVNGEYVATSTKLAYANDGITPLAVVGEEGTAIRANVIVMNRNSTGERHSFTMYGWLTKNSVEDGGATIKFDTSDGKYFPYDNVSGPDRSALEFAICGMAYLEAGDNPTDTPLGLVSRDPKLHRGDAGDGDVGDLNEFNKFYAVTADDDQLTKIPYMDKRYVLATVYQTATSTFPWALNNRRKMAALNRTWTDEFHVSHNGSKTVMQSVYEENQKLFKLISEEFDTRPLSANNYPMTFNSTAPWNSLASRLRVVFRATYNNSPYVQPAGNPVRMARWAVTTLANDFRKMRLLSYKSYNGRNKKARVKVAGLPLEIEDWPTAGDTIRKTIEPPDVSTEPTWEQDLMASIWCSNLRNLPEYVANPTNTTLPDIFADDKWYEYILREDNPYHCEAMKSSSATETLPYAGDTGCETYSDNSVITKCLPQLVGNVSKHTELVEDMRRYAETVLAVKIDEDAYMNLSNVGGIDNANKDWMNPFTNIQSIDSVPYPVIDVATLNLFTEHQRPFASADAVQTYRYEVDDDADPVTSVSTVMSMDNNDVAESEQLAKLVEFVETYVAPYGAKLPLHQYQSSRVQLKQGNIPVATDPIYIRTIKRMKNRMGLTEQLISSYLNDSFAITDADTRDPNVDRADVSDASIGVSAPPYVTPLNVANQTYTRVIMQFTFSQKAGRWYTTGYRQCPTNYLTPLYGSDALSTLWPSMYTETGSIAPKWNSVTHQFENDTLLPLWRNSSCIGLNSYRSHMYFPYSSVPPMDLTLGCVPYLNTNQSWVFDGSDYTGQILPSFDSNDDTAELMPLSHLERPYLPQDEGGINLYPPANVNGEHLDSTDNGLHANFWSVRKYIRPAVSVLKGTDIPGHDVFPDEGEEPQPSHKNGLISDATMYRMFDFPMPGTVEYKLPNEVNPEDDMAKTHLHYGEVHGNRVPEGIIKTHQTGVSLGYGVSEEKQEIDRT